MKYYVFNDNGVYKIHKLNLTVKKGSMQTILMAGFLQLHIFLLHLVLLGGQVVHFWNN